MRIVHLGLGAFHRAHQAWYTARASDAHEWGIAAFTGRSSRLAEQLRAQQCRYSLVERSAERDAVQTIGSIVAAYPGTDTTALNTHVADPAVAVITLTITEAGWRDETPTGTVGRLVDALTARAHAGSGPIAVVPCDNVGSNGQVARTTLLRLARRSGASSAGWIEENVSFVSTSVDRITPRLRDADAAGISAVVGWDDRVPVLTEPFSDWVLSGDFPRGRPDWESAGARFVDDVEPWERRKLWLLNGGHTALAAIGTLRGHRTVAQAIADPVCRSLVRRLWDESRRHLPDLHLDGYLDALLERWGNARLDHELRQIATDSALKVAQRIVPVARREVAARGSAPACAEVIGTWAAAASVDPEAALRDLDDSLADDAGFRERVASAQRDAAAGRFSPTEERIRP